MNNRPKLALTACARPGGMDTGHVRVIREVEIQSSMRGFGTLAVYVVASLLLHASILVSTIFYLREGGREGKREGGREREEGREREGREGEGKGEREGAGGGREGERERGRNGGGELMIRMATKIGDRITHTI